MIQLNYMSSETELTHSQPQPSFDLQSLVIDEEQTQQFFESKGSGERGSNVLRMAKDKDDQLVLLKTSAFFKGEDKVLTTPELLADFPNLKINQTPEEFLNEVTEPLRLQEAAYKLADYLGVPMVESWFVEIQDTPYLALKYMAGAIDRGFGSKIDYQPDQGQNQAVALGALYKFLLNANQDDGQYLQAPDGTVYLSDLRISTHLNTPGSLEQTLLFVLSQGASIPHPVHGYPYRTQGFFAEPLATVQRQLLAINSLSFQTALHRLEGLTPAIVLSFMAKDPNQPTPLEIHTSQVLVARAQQARPIFTLLADMPDVAETALNPFVGPGQRKSPTEEVLSAREKLITELVNRSTL